MKKIPTLFERVYENHKVVGITKTVTPGCEWVLDGYGTATVKYDGACCAVIGGTLYKRYDAKAGKKVPIGAIKCQEKPDPVTGHMPCWIPCDRDNPSDKWFWSAYDNTRGERGGLEDWTYEAMGPHFQGNPQQMDKDFLLAHGQNEIEVERTFDGIREFLREHEIEGIVFWKDGEPRCKIKRSDFGFPWMNKK